MKTIALDASTWTTPVDFYEALRVVVGAPEWHGLGPDAFLDSMNWHDEINAQKSPYTLKVEGLGQAPRPVQAEVVALANLLRKAGAHDLGSDLHVELQIT